MFEPPRIARGTAMIRTPTDAIDRAVQQYLTGHTLVVLADYDGTLAPIVEAPHLAVLGETERKVLRKLSQLPRVTVGILSSRTLSEVQNMVRVRGLYFAGTGGMEVDLRGRRVRHPRAREAAILMNAIVRDLKGVIQEETGARIEHKTYGVTIHYRDVAEERLGGLLDTIQEALEPWAPRIMSFAGPGAEEVLPSRGWTKGSAVGLILDHVGRNQAMPIFLGDDADAFAVVRTHGGIAIGVGRRAPPNATLQLPGLEALSEFLSGLHDAIAVES